MKNVFLTILGVIAISFAASAQGKLEVNKVVHDFGKLSEGPVATYTFEVKNTGKNPLIFIDCKTSCGCFVADCPKDAVEPGKTVKIRSRFSGIGREGAQEKSLVLHCNTKTEFHILRINGFVRKD